MKIENLSSVSLPFYEGDLTEITTDHEFINDDRDWFWEQFFIDENGNSMFSKSGILSGYTSKTVSVRRDNMVYVYNVDGKLGLPMLSAKIINQRTKVSGEGFFGLYKSLHGKVEGGPDYIFKKELEKIRNCKDWYKLTDYLGIKVEGIEK